MINITITSGGPKIVHNKTVYAPIHDNHLGRDLCLNAIRAGFKVNHWRFINSSQPPEIGDTYGPFLYRSEVFHNENFLVNKFSGHFFGLTHCLVLGHLYDTMEESTKIIINEVYKNRPDLPVVLLAWTDELDQCTICNYLNTGVDAVIQAYDAKHPQVQKIQISEDLIKEGMKIPDYTDYWRRSPAETAIYLAATLVQRAIKLH